MKRPKRLSATFVKTINIPGRYGDGRGGYGLSLLVHETVDGRISKSFAQRLRFNGEPFNLGLGTFPVVTLAEARGEALENFRAVFKGIDIRAERKRKPIPTFAQAAETVIAIHAQTWKVGGKSEAQWRSSLSQYAFPLLGDIAVSEIETPDVMAVLTPIWSDKRETAQRVRQRISAILDWAIAQNYRKDNPTTATKSALPKSSGRREHLPAIPFADVSSALTKIKSSDAWEITKLAMEYLTLTATRSGETREATWDEIDIEATTWIIPASRMKAKLEHRIPLSDRSKTILQDALEYRDDSGLIFPSTRGKPLSDNTLSKLLRELNIPGTPHGMRSAFRDWAAEKTAYSSEIAEHALAHIEGSATERAYRRTDFFDLRRQLMQDWADFLNR